MGSTILDEDTCLVCGGETSGLHFQVTVCRACAAFFRRSVKAKKVYRCRRGTRNCELTKNTSGRPICRFCRLQKCYHVGMRYDLSEKENGNTSPDMIASRRVPTISTSDDSPPRQNSLEAYQPQMSDTPYTQIGAQNGHLKRNIEPIIEKVKNILNQEFPPPMYNAPDGIHMTPLQQLQYGFASFSTMVRPEIDDVEIAETMDKFESIKFQEDYCVKAAELAMCCEPFAKLDFLDKYLLFRHYWSVFYALERIYSSIELFGYEMDDNRHLVNDKVVADGNTKWEIVGISEEKAREFINFCQPLKDNRIQNIAIPMKMLRITRFEVVYMLAQLLWSVYEIKGISDHAKSVGERVLEQIGSELHNFYLYDMHLANYASRHAKLIRLLSVAKHQVQLCKDFFIMARIFNIFEVDLFESELID